MNNNKSVKIIAFYLPQFHAISENDEAYGKGFTEWTNTKKAKPLFAGHYQPKSPLNSNYYCLLDQGVMEKQAELAKKYGVYGFCYYHYWFKNGKKLLEKPLENMLENKNVNMPFCLCWANENWTKRWDGGNNEIIVEQDYDDYVDLNNHVDYLCVFFKDSRYIKDQNDRPIFIIYKPELIPNLSKFIKQFRNRVKENGIGDICILIQYPKYYFNGSHLSYFDGYIQFEPKFIQDYEAERNRSTIKKVVKKILLNLGLNKLNNSVEAFLTKKHTCGKTPELTIRNYDTDWKHIIEYQVKDTKLIAGAFTDWDNTARNKSGLVYSGSSPEKFEKYIKELVVKVKREYNSQMIFINAWNEWAEGAYLEPDEKYGFRYLEALKDALLNDEK